MLALAMGKDYIKMAPKPARSPSHFHWPETGHVVLDVDAGNVYRKYSIEPESPAKGDFV